MTQPTEPPVPPDTTSVSELFAKLATETGSLIRREVSLAALEYSEKARAITRIAWSTGAGLLIGLVGGQTLALAAVLGLAEALPMWLAALAVGTALLLVGGIVIASGRSAMARIELSPRKTIETLKESKAWARQLVQ